MLYFKNVKILLILTPFHKKNYNKISSLHAKDVNTRFTSKLQKYTNKTILECLSVSHIINK